MRRTALALIVLGLLIHGGGRVAAQRGQWESYGPTIDSCGTFTKTTGANRVALEWWVLGFVSGAGYAQSQSGVGLAKTDPDGVTEWVAKYCADHPLDPFARAVIELVAELGKRR